MRWQEDSFEGSFYPDSWLGAIRMCLAAFKVIEKRKKESLPDPRSTHQEPRFPASPTNPTGYSFQYNIRYRMQSRTAIHLSFPLQITSRQSQLTEVGPYHLVCSSHISAVNILEILFLLCYSNRPRSASQYQNEIDITGR